MKSDSKSSIFHVTAIVGATIALYSLGGMIFEKQITPSASAQSDRFLEQRINQMEQRFYGIESRLNRLETATRSTLRAPPRGNDLELERLRTEVDGLRLRLGETECGLQRLDERTLTPAARMIRSKGQSGACRLNWGSPVQLSARP